jgi:hypothetical protein
MKKIYIILVGFIAGFAFAQTSPQSTWRMTIKVVDEDGNPIGGAKAGVGYYTHSQPAAIDGVTDTNGIFIVEHSVEPSYGGYALGFGADKPGYYSVHESQLLPPTYDAAKWNQNIVLVLKKIGHPIAMYAKHVETKTPKENEPIGFDLTAGDWVTPYGTGKTADIFFTVHRKVISVHEYDAELSLTFPNKGDGIAVAPQQPSIGSDFTTSRTASDGGYEPERSWHYSNSETPLSVFGYFIRVRTVLDENGNIKSALYGKIIGDISLYVGTKVPQSGIGFTYCLNPTPNDRNLEFDPSRNLLKGLLHMQQVKEP